MRLRRRVLTGILAAGLAAGARAQDAAAGASAAAWLRGVYGRYVSSTGQAPGIALTEAAIARWFIPPLAQAILADRADAATRNEPPALNGDPFVLAQDWAFRSAEISANAPGRDRAVGTVRLSGAGEPVVLRVALERVEGSWRIADVARAEESLVGIVEPFWPLAFTPRRD